MENRIKKLKVLKNISQQELANQLNGTRQAIIRFENGTINTSAENLIVLANFTVEHIILNDNEQITKKVPFWTN